MCTLPQSCLKKFYDFRSIHWQLPAPEFSHKGSEDTPERKKMWNFHNLVQELLTWHSSVTRPPSRTDAKCVKSELMTVFCGISQITFELSYQLKGSGRRPGNAHGSDGDRPGAEPAQESEHRVGGAACHAFWSTAASSHSRFIVTWAPGEAIRKWLSLPGWGKASPNTSQPVWPDSNLIIQILKPQWVPA